MEVQKLEFTKVDENEYEATYTTQSDHDVLQAELPEEVGMTVYVRVPGETGRQPLGSVSSLAPRTAVFELAIPTGMEVVVSVSRKGSENVSAVIGIGE